MMQKRATSGALWRKTRLEGELVRLPSGNIARLRNVRPVKLMLNGEIPDALTPIVASMLSGDDGKKAAGELSPEKLIEASNALTEAVCREAFVEPRIVENPTADDEICMDDLENRDAEFVMNLLYTPVGVLAKSFPLTDETVADLAENEAVQTPSL